MIITIVSGEGFTPSERLSLLFPPLRREKLARLHTPEGRTQSACAEMAFMLTCKRALGFVPAYEIGFNGKPDLVDGARGHISLSHAGPYGLCAWSRQIVGADIESAERDLSRMARRVRAEGDGETDLNLLWCVKESFVKRTGEGLSHPFPQLIVRGNAVFDPQNVCLAHYEAGRLGAFLWCACTEKREPVTLAVLSAAEAEAQLLPELA